MSTRLQVLFPDDEIAAIRDAAARERVPVATWVRRVLREALATETLPTRPTLAVREAAPAGYPLADTARDLAQLEEILARLDGEDTDAEAAWDAEIARRIDELRAGRARLISAEEVLDAIRRKRGW